MLLGCHPAYGPVEGVRLGRVLRGSWQARCQGRLLVLVVWVLGRRCSELCDGGRVDGYLVVHPD